MKKFKKRAPILAMVALLVVGLIGGTFAYFSQSSTASNFLSAKDYNSTLTEEFTPPQDGNFTPGVEYEKVVGVTNSGDVGMLVRIKYEEFWGGDAVALTYADAVDGWYDGVNESDSVVSKRAGDPSTNENGNWVYGGDGYYYFLAELKPGDSTDSFIESIMLKDSTLTQETSYEVVFWNAATEEYTVAANYEDEAAITTALGGLPAGSYVSSKVMNTKNTMAQTGQYELRFTVDTVQAVSEPAKLWQDSATVEGVDTFLGGFILP